MLCGSQKAPAATVDADYAYAFDYGADTPVFTHPENYDPEIHDARRAFLEWAFLAVALAAVLVWRFRQGRR